MRNVDPTALGMAPTRLILKLGDDLRQDVIVLRMLSLFEKVSEIIPNAATIGAGIIAVSYFFSFGRETDYRICI